MIQIIEFLTLALCLPTIVTAVTVLSHWFPDAKEAYTTPSVFRSASQWLLLGIFVSFLGSAFDNLYWTVAWSADYIGAKDLRDFLFEHGSIPNLPFRQNAGIYAAYCHMKSYYVAKEKNSRMPETMILFANFVGVVHMIVLHLCLV